MKNYIKPNTLIVNVDPRIVYALGTDSDGVGKGNPLTKRNDGWEYDDEDEDDGLW